MKPVIHQEFNTLTFHCPACNALHGVKVLKWEFNKDLVRPTVYVPVFSGHGNVLCHSHVRDGVIHFMPDSTHALAGRSVSLPRYPY